MKKVISAILVIIILLMICTGCSKPTTDFGVNNVIIIKETEEK